LQEVSNYCAASFVDFFSSDERRSITKQGWF